MLALLLAAAVAQLSFGELFEKQGELRPSQHVQGLAGKRVRVDGFMAHLEQPPKGAFWLCRKPLVIDEGGAGTGDLPVESILVILTPPTDQDVPPLHRPLRVEGRLEVGSKQAPDGTLSFFRIVLDAAHSRKATQSKLQKENP
ncbi:MAG: hypothetical protein NVS2B9_00760 [Myxococcales bacterium]